MAIDILGWLGMVVLLGAFALASMRRIRDDRYLYHVINLLGAVGVGINAYSKGVMPSATVEVIWGGIALVGLVNIWRRRPHGLG